MQRNTALRSFLCGFKFNFSGNIDSTLAFDRRRRFQFANQPVHVGFEFRRWAKRCRIDRAEEMTARFLVGIQSRDRAGEHATENFHEDS